MLPVGAGSWDNTGMKQIDLGLNLGAKRTRKRAFLHEAGSDRVVARGARVVPIAPFAA